MAHQPTPSVNTVLDHTTEKIILSGTRFISSMFGEDQGITAAAIPVFYRNPIISGTVTYGSTLSCEPYSYNASPRGTITYQWKLDTVNITDATSQTYVTVIGDIDGSVTCEVTVTNPSGADVATSNAIVVSDILPIVVNEFDIYPINGLASVGRIDVVAENLLVVLGVPVVGAETITEMDTYIIQAIAMPDSIYVNDAEIYAMFLPTLLTPLVVRSVGRNMA